MGQYSRGNLTPNVQAAAAKTVIPFPNLTQAELRMMVYIQYLTLNTECLDPRRVDGTDRRIFSGWRKSGYVDGGASSHVSMSRDFWDSVNAIIWEGYARPDT